jgi:hypothetical protein
MNSKTGVNLLRQAGIILIALPEPTTTVLGIACIAAAQYLSKSQGKSRPKLSGQKKLNRFPQDFCFPDEFENNNRTGKKLNYYSYDRCRSHRTAVRNQYKRQFIDTRSPYYVIPEGTQTIQNCDNIPEYKRPACIKVREIILSREQANQVIKPEISNHKLNIDAITKRYQYINRRNEADAKPVKCNIDMQKLQRYKDNDKRQYESAKIKASVPEIKLHNIDMDALVKRYSRAS